ncbi:MAG: CDF family Co(II)/Ni(II) efflux transporter DmeF [Steroidobacterales bacterium]
MSGYAAGGLVHGHSHVFLAADHERSERRTWAVIVLCGVMMAAEIVGGLLFGSIALVADGLHMSTHAGALLLAALAYRYSRGHAHDARFSFGTGKLGDLAGFTSAVILAMIALLIGYESIARLLQPVAIHFAEAIPIAGLGLAVNIISAWLLSGSNAHHHGNDAQAHAAGAEEHTIAADSGELYLTVHEDRVPPRFRLRTSDPARLQAQSTTIETVRPDGARHLFAMKQQGEYLESVEEIPEPHNFTAIVRIGAASQYRAVFAEHHHGSAGAHRDNNMRAAIIHVAADAAVSMLVIVGLVLARSFGWLWMDPLAGIVGACVIASWSYGLVRDTGAILLDMNPDPKLAENLRTTIEDGGDRLADLHLWRVGPGHLAAIICVVTSQPRPARYYRERLARYKILSHVTVEVMPHNAM